MKIGISMRRGALDYARWGDECYKKMKQHGFSCVDFNLSETENFLYVSDWVTAESLLLKEKRLADEAGIKFSQVHGPWRYPPRDSSPQEREERMEKMKKSIRAAALLGCQNWVVHPIMPYGIEDANTENAEKTWQLNTEFMSELLKTAKQYHVTVCLENMPMTNFSMSRPQDILRFAQQINDENFKICLDTGHVAVFPDLSLAEETRRLGKEIRVLHVHDNLCDQDSHLMPYFGKINWGSFGEALKEIDYKGVFSLETMPPANLPADVFEEMCCNLCKIAKTIVNGIDD